MSIERGTVVRVVKDRAYVMFCGETADCGGCKACLFSRPADGLEMPVFNTLNAKPGDEIEVERRTGRSMPAVVLFGIPIIMLIVFAAVAAQLVGDYEWLVALIALVGAIVVFVPLVMVDKRLLKSGKLGGKMLRIIGPADNE